MATTDTTNESLTSYRVAMLEELGFSKPEAEALSECYYDVTLKAKSKNDKIRTYRIKVDHHYVRKMLNAGATRVQVLDILT
jgi:hypothetical protein